MRLARARLQLAFRAHVELHALQVNVEFLTVKDVLTLEARNQSGFLDILHLPTQFLVAENLIALEVNLDHAHARAFADSVSQGNRSLRDDILLQVYGRIRMSLRR